jgi:Tol biopolymer transport system component
VPTSDDGVYAANTKILVRPSDRKPAALEMPSEGAQGFTSCCGVPRAWVVHPDGAALRRVTPLGRAVFLTPVWSPDSTKLFNRLDRHGQISLWTGNTDGSGLSRLTDPVSSAFPYSYAWGSGPAD